MFNAHQSTSFRSAFFRFLEVVYHSTVRSIRKSDGNAVLGLLKSVMQSLIMVVIFFIMLSLLGGRGMAVRGDYFIYLLSGVFIFMTHVKTIGAVAGADGPSAPMMLHTPMNSLVSILSSALSTLYTQLIGLFAILSVYHIAVNPIEIEHPIQSLGMVLLGWYSGIGVGYIFLALRPWIPGLVNSIKLIYVRLNMFASGKMVVANTLPFSMLPIFIWNPLFHTIDQARGFIFINYTPHHTSWGYAFWLSTALIAIGFIGEGWVRQMMSVSFSRRS